MVSKKEFVNINIQTILALIPIVDLWAAYRIEKFRFWCGLLVGFFLFGFSIDETLRYPYNVIVIMVIEIPIAVYLMRKWSKEWNAQFSSDNP
ncbi:MAG: hypothetical protein HW410_1027 [Nitrosarchaeum sp.]|nr:hypothetical protein [Nitrosarchaeum sp.]